MKNALLVILLLAASSFNASAMETKGNPRFDEFYTVKEKSVSFSDHVSLNPLDTAQKWWSESDEFAELRATVFNLLDFEHHAEKYGDVNEPYNRQKHFGGWINDRRDDTCLNTRGKVLVRDSSVDVTMNTNGCSVRAGRWDDPYSGREYTQAADIQIDHYVALKNAYISGAYKWDRAKRCLYANYLGNNFHLLAVYGKENNSKSDKTPEGWMPSNKSYHCQYLAQWLKVKMIWSLGLTPPEKDAVVELVQQNHCDLSQMKYSAQELDEQRRFIADNKDLCQ
ncbi:HNH endonuclease family protein [Bdellovibrio sp. 22V]|uniref:HNH endonuclease family protein n=1 Tax=Bdellovibrio sp. 22V TaxID=3044166 RepID=UPI0025435B1E|nr:HNH endonuclease family protein [Bdellovibrio sp. 22V]WII73658.1 HNH endonuclease family protein [Bdellovibrio sp. 22V]